MRDPSDKSDRLASLGAMAAGIIHEINTPLSIIAANTEYLLDPGRDRALDATVLGEIKQACTRIQGIVGDLRLFSRPPAQAGTADRSSVEDAVSWALRTTAHELRNRAEVSCDLQAELPPVRGDQGRLSHLMVSLLLNAAQAIDPGRHGQHLVRVIARRLPADDRLELTVQDSGAPINLDEVSSSLAIALKVVGELGGSLRIEHRPGVGNQIVTHLPLAMPAQRASARGAQRKRVLVIDDDELVRKVLERILESEHEVRCVADARLGLSMLEADHGFDLVLCDMSMPEMSGMEFYDRLLHERPDDARRVIFLSAGAATPRIASFLAALPDRHLEKPFDIECVRDIVRRAL